MIISHLIIIICGVKMFYYVNLHTGFDQNMKRLLKQLTKTLIILVIIPIINQFLTILIIFSNFNNVKQSPEETNTILIYNHKLIIYIFLSSFTHFTPVFNPIVCIITNKPYKEAVLNRLRIHPQ
ncbi:unnamed protein product [Meloidogyne enterolobii]|uniref:Uncharacterized protein n=1 Tax=Meloidogyne enterolobii TaxID=390850 RepID=A0ACB0ZXM6_MELEN